MRKRDQSGVHTFRVSIHQLYHLFCDSTISLMGMAACEVPWIGLPGIKDRFALHRLMKSEMYAISFHEPELTSPDADLRYNHKRICELFKVKGIFSCGSHLRSS